MIQCARPRFAVDVDVANATDATDATDVANAIAIFVAVVIARKSELQALNVSLFCCIAAKAVALFSLPLAHVSRSS